MKSSISPSPMTSRSRLQAPSKLRMNPLNLKGRPGGTLAALQINNKRLLPRWEYKVNLILAINNQIGGRVKAAKTFTLATNIKRKISQSWVSSTKINKCLKMSSFSSNNWFGTPAVYRLGKWTFSSPGRGLISRHCPTLVFRKTGPSSSCTNAATTIRKSSRQQIWRPSTTSSSYFRPSLQARSKKRYLSNSKNSMTESQPCNVVPKIMTSMNSLEPHVNSI